MKYQIYDAIEKKIMTELLKISKNSEITRYLIVAELI